MYQHRFVIPCLKSQFRSISGGEVAKKLRGVNRLKHLDQFPSAQPASKIKNEKELFARELLQAQRELITEFDTQLYKSQGNEPDKSEDMKQLKFDHTKESLRLYGLLRPHALPFYKEDSLVNMERRLGNVIGKIGEAEEEKNSEISSLLPMPLQNYLPEINSDAFILSIQAVAQSLADDIEELCQFLMIDNLPTRHDPLRLNILLNHLLESFKLSNEPSEVNAWMINCWPRLKKILPTSITSNSDEEISDWLRGHLSRVKQNKKAYTSVENDDQWYNFSKDFIFDDYPIPSSFVKESKSKFPLEEAQNYLKKFASFFELSSDQISQDTLKLFQEFIYNLEKIGLSNWLKMDDIREFENKLPEGIIPKIEINNENIKTSKFITKLAARGKINTLDLPTIDPHTLLHEGSKHPQMALLNIPENACINDNEIDELFNENELKSIFRQTHSHTDKMKKFINKFGKTPIEQLFQSEKEFEASTSPIEWFNENSKISWRWKAPENASFDATRKAYVRNVEGIDPKLNLSELRTTVLNLNKMMNMTKDGRVFFFRAIVAVGNGRGLFGIGVGYGNNARTARLEGSIDAVKKCEFVDFDKSGLLTTPVHGREYSAHVKIIPRPRGKGVMCNRKFLPLAYIMGLENCKFSFSGPSTRWITRARAIQRALDGVQSLKTISNSTGQKLSDVMTPGEHWVHWPDRWFGPIYTHNYTREGVHDKLKTTNRFALKKLAGKDN